MKKKHFAALLAAVLCVSVLTACSQNGSQTVNPSSNPDSGNNSQRSTPADLLAQIQERGEIVVAMEGTWAPWPYHDESDQLVGYDVEVARNIAQRLGVEVNFAEGEWDGLLASVDSGRYDIMVNGVDIDEARSEKYDFSTPYAYNRTAVIVSGENDSIQSMEDLNGKSTASTQVAIPMRKGEESASLAAAINEALAEMAEDGTLTKLSMKYFGTDISQKQ